MRSITGKGAKYCSHPFHLVLSQVLLKYVFTLCRIPGPVATIAGILERLDPLSLVEGWRVIYQVTAECQNTLLFDGQFIAHMSD